MQQQEVAGTELFNQNVETPQEQAPEEQAKPEVNESAPIYLGGKKFNNVDELAAYTAKLEQDNRIAASSLQTKPVQTQAEKPLSELIFEDPEKALAIHEQKVIQKLKAEEAQRASEQKFWTDFYKENKDLSDDSELVQFVISRLILPRL